MFLVFIKWILQRMKGFKVSSSDGVWRIEIDSLCLPSGSEQGWEGLNTDVR